MKLVFQKETHAFQTQEAFQFKPASQTILWNSIALDRSE